MIRDEFHRFIESLDPALVSDDEWRLLNVIANHLDSVIPLGTAAGRRSKYIIRIAFPNFDELSVDIPRPPQGTSNSVPRVHRLNSLAIGPFRGFAREELFDINSELVLLYGPNGSGKSSFCEALELALLGTVNDSSAKRIESEEYLKNARTGSFEPPVLTATFENGEVDSVAANSDHFRFCFVEKNRIDDFSRIASFTPSLQERIIASLFGIQEFDSFVTNFNESVETYLPNDSRAANELQQLEDSLASYKQIVGSKTQILGDLDRSEKELADSYRDGMPYRDFALEIGDPESGKIKELTDRLGEQLRPKVGASKTLLDHVATGVLSAWNKVESLKEQRLARANELSYRDLYKSVLALESNNPETCPACDTPLSGGQRALSNPFTKARAGLEELTELDQIEHQLDEANGQLELRVGGLLALLKNIEENLEEDERQNELATGLRDALTSAELEPRSMWWQGLFGSSADANSVGRSYLYQCAERMEQEDEALSNQELAREALRGELTALSSLREKIIQRATQRQSKEREIERAEAALQDAEATLVQARQEATDEGVLNGIRQRIVNAYAGLMGHLQDYRERLPASLLANIGGSVVTLYNAFNRRDHAGDFMADIKLPLKPGDRIMYSCVSAPERYFDALHVLSEGHIRCLGLAIVLAKNLETDCPMLIFDDPVNAIDDDHREGIRRTLFEDSYFAEKQIILTCHGEEFTKDIQNLIGAENARVRCKCYTFLPHTGDNHVQVEVAATKNHILAARTHFNRNEFRESLADARRGLEWATNAIWTKVLPRAGVRALSVQVSKPGTKPELMNLVQSLVREIERNSFVSAQKIELAAGLNAIKGVNPTSREWEYLNKGTHEEEDRTEFDQGIVRGVVEALELLDRAIDASRRQAEQPV